MKKMNFLKCSITFICVIFALSSYSAIIYVDKSATGLNDGTSWTDAYNDLQDAISNGSSGDEIWIAKGTYYPTATTDRTINYYLTYEVSIYGHFDGNESSINERDLSDVLDLNANRTILSGNIGNQSINTDNSHYLIKSKPSGNDSYLINGITASEAYSYATSGHAIHLRTGSGNITITNTLIYNNQGGWAASGLEVDASGNGNTLIENCRFRSNSAVTASAYYGIGGTTIVRNSDFIDNLATSNAYAVYGKNTNMTFENCSFTLNKSNSSNSAHGTCIGTFQLTTPVDISNSIFWNNGDASHTTEILARSNTTVSNSIVEGGYGGTVQTSVLNQDPLWTDTDLNLDFNSPAIDAGNNSLYTSSSTIDIDGDQRILNTTIDMGSQEYTEAPNPRIYVNHAATGLNDGTSWTNAYNNLQDAFINTSDGYEIWIAKGTYYPTASTDRTIYFSIVKELSIYGHFNGNEESINDRDLSDVLDLNSNRTILSGNIGDPMINTDNSHYLIKSGNGNFRNYLIDGITVQDVYSSSIQGQAMKIVNNSYTDDVIIKNVLFYNNKSGYRASGLEVFGSGFALIENCRFKNNTAITASAYLKTSGTTTIRNSDFVDNLTTTNAYAVYNWNADMTIENCSFTLNKSNSINSAHGTCVGSYQSTSPVNISNSIFWNNGDASHTTEIQAKTTVVVSSSIVEGGYGGSIQTNVINQDPLWVDDDLNLDVISPAIDAGDNVLYTSTSPIDIDGGYRIFNNTIDLGTQEYELNSDAFAITVKTTKSNQIVTLPTLSGQTYSYNVDWGDGTTETNIIGDVNHIYNYAGNHQINITNTFPAINYGKQNQTEREKIISIDQWGVGQWNSLSNAFSDCSNLEYNALDNPDLTNTTSLNAMFKNCDLIDGDLNGWDVSNITDMAYTFNGATAFNGDITNWQTQNVTDMSYLFSAAQAFNQDISGWDVGNVTNMSNAFSATSVFNHDLEYWEIKKVANMQHIFTGSGLNECNYDRTLRGWSNQVTNHTPILDAEGIKYGTDQFKKNLITKGWVITDAGQGTVCTSLRLKSKTISLDEESLENELSIYPNPTSNHFTINGVQESSKIEIYDTKGKLVIEQTIIGQTNFDLSNLPSGVYVISIGQHAKSPIIKKLIKN